MMVAIGSTLTSVAAAAVVSALALVASGCPPSGGDCASSASCGDGELCYAGRCVAALPAGSCTPPGSPIVSASPSDSSAAVASDYAGCRFPVVAPPAVTIPAGWIAPVTAGGVTSAVSATAPVGTEVSFVVPAGTSSVTIHSQGRAAAATFSYGGGDIPNSVVPTAVRLPNGHLLFDDLISPPPDPTFSGAYYGGLTPWTGTFGVPNTWRFADFSLGRGELPAGTWSFRVNDWNAECPTFTGCTASPVTGSYDVTVLTRPGPYVSTGNLDLNIYVVGGAPGLTAGTAAQDPSLVRFVDGVGRLLGEAGICLDRVTFWNVPSWARIDPRFTEPSIDESPPCGELSQLFTLAARVDGVHLFLVDTLTTTQATGSGRIVGIDGSIPGPSGIPGAYTSGAAMTLADLLVEGGCGAAVDLESCGPDRAAYIAAHEIGHWLGLYHTTEASGDLFDPLPDTASCPCGACGNRTCGDAPMWPASCASTGEACGGGQNLMFWFLDPAYSSGRVTSQQALVARMNPAVK